MVLLIWPGPSSCPHSQQPSSTISTRLPPAMVKTTRKKSYHGFETRLETFSGARMAGSKARSRKVTWPHAQPTAHAVAKVGFYFTPAQTEYGTDLVTCYLCGSGIDGWEPEDDPLKVHIENCASCPLAMIQSKPWDNDQDHDPHSSPVLGARLQTFYHPLSNDELEEAIKNYNDADAKSLSASTIMLMGTSVWPHDAKKGWAPTSERMAKAGFYYWPNQSGEDYGVCPYCNLGLDGWEKDDDPLEEHKHHSPSCMFFDNAPPAEEAHKSATRRIIDVSDSEGYESAASTASTTSTSNKRKKKSTTAKKSTKKLSVSEWSDSDASTTSKPLKKRGRQSKKAATNTAAKEKAKMRLSAFEDDDQLFSGAKTNSNSLSSTLESFMSPPAKVAPKSELSKGSVLAKVSRFEGYMEDAAAPTNSNRKSKLQKTMSVQVKPETQKVDVSRSQSMKEGDASTKYDSSDDDSMIMRKPLRPSSKSSSTRSVLEQDIFPNKKSSSSFTLPFSEPDLKGVSVKKEERPLPLPPSKPIEATKAETASNKLSPQDEPAGKSMPAQFSPKEEKEDQQLQQKEHTPETKPREIPKSPWLSKPQPSPKIFQDELSEQSGHEDEEMQDARYGDDDHGDDYENNHNHGGSDNWSAELPMPGKIPLRDTSPHVRNRTPPPAMYVVDDDGRHTPNGGKKTSAPVAAVVAAPKPRKVSAGTPVKQTISSPARQATAASSTTQWAGIDPDMVFELLASTDGDNNENDSNAVLPPQFLEEALGGAHLDKTVREWVDVLAEQGERALRSKCEALVAMLEREGRRAIAALENMAVEPPARS